MDWLHVPNLPGSGKLGGYEYGLEGGPAKKRLRTSKSHGSLLGSVRDAVRRPLETLGSLGESLGLVSDRDGWHLTPEERERRLQLLRLEGAKDVEEWKEAARELDRLEGAEEWKLEDESEEYNASLIKERLLQLDTARENRDVKGMLFLMRTSLTRDLGGMGDLRLYKHSRIGTKSLIERYIQSVQDTLETLIGCASHGESSDLNVRHLHAEMLLIRQSFGRTALLLSGGGTLGMNHIGVIKALFEANLLPRVISGASAGSIVCAVLCTKTDKEMPSILDEFCYGELDVFEKEGEADSYLTKARRFLKDGALFDIKHLTRVMQNLMGDTTFKEAYFRSNRILNITVSSASVYDAPRLLNYYTAPNVLIWSAVAASCSVPMFFTPAALKAKDVRTHKVVDWVPSTQRWIDGSVDNDIPTVRLAEMFNVNHFIVSQVNPHVVPFIRQEEDFVAAEARQPPTNNYEEDDEPKETVPPSWLHAAAHLAKSETLHRLHVLSDLGVFSNALSKVRSVLGQRYSGDITIFPEISYAHFPSVLNNPTTEFMVQAMLCGERATWPKLSRIRNHCTIELALDRAVHKLKDRVAFSPSQADLRLNVLSQAALDRHSERGRRRRGSTSSHRTVQSAVLPRARQTIHPTIEPFSNPAVKVADYFSGGDSTSPTSHTPRQYPHHPSNEPSYPRSYDSYDSDTDSLSPTTNSEHSSLDSPSPERAPSRHRRPKTHTSQPPTPMPLSSPWNESPRAFRTGGRGLSPNPPTGALAMTLSPRPRSRGRGAASAATEGPRPSSPELKYKRLFHGVGKASGAGSGVDGATVAKGEGGKTTGRRKFGIAGLLGGSGVGSAGAGAGAAGDEAAERTRLRRNFSTGFEGLRPPGRR
ncbi:hypothetical protein MBLNU230_g2414t1 [Neophaeotheca triangularis]